MNQPSGIDPKFSTNIFVQIESKLKSEALHIVQDHLRDESEKFRQELTDYIKSQPNDWPPLSEGYIRSKIRKGLDHRMLIATGELLRSYIIVPLEGGLGYVVRTSNRIHKGSNVKISLLDRWLEYGTLRMPARPHWRPVIEKLKSRKQEIADILTAKILTKVRVKVK